MAATDMIAHILVGSYRLLIHFVAESSVLLLQCRHCCIAQHWSEGLEVVILYLAAYSFLIDARAAAHGPERASGTIPLKVCFVRIAGFRVRCRK